MDEEILEQIGLTKAQATIYLTLLKLGVTKIGKIIEETNLQSSVVHNNINKLIDKGIVNFVLIGKIKHYNIANPETLQIFLDKEEESLKKRREKLKSIIPQLKTLKKVQETGEVEVYKGKSGLMTAFREEYDKVKSKQTVKFIALPKEYHEDEEVSLFFKRVNNALFEKKCKILGIGHESLKQDWKKKYTNKNYSFKYITMDFPFDINIFEDSILLSLWGEKPIVIRIQDPEFVKQSNRFFEEMWKNQ